MLVKNQCRYWARVALSEPIEGAGMKKERLLVRIRCKQWSCPYCSTANRKAWRRALIAQIPAHGQDWSFWTVTMPAWVHSKPSDIERAETSAKIIRENWSKLHKRLKRTLGAFEYLRVVEEHKSGALHLHLLVNLHVEKLIKVTRDNDSEYHYRADILEHYRACGFGYIMDIRNLDRATSGDDLETANAVNVAQYCTKYMTKADFNLESALSKVNVRRIQTSRGFKSPFASGNSGLAWTLKASGFEKHETLGAGIVTVDMNKKRIVTHEDYRENEVYPSPDERRIP